MSYFHSFKGTNHGLARLPRLITLVLAAAAIILGIYQHTNAPSQLNAPGDKATASSTISMLSPTIQPSAPKFNHQNIITTYFWIGEPGDSDNGYIANATSAWDEHWQQHYGGVDNPTSRRDYQPTAFTPKENPFYAALPYSDVTDSGQRKASATSCPEYRLLKNKPYSWCKNSWIAIRHGGKIAYAQWEDVGPFQTNDTAYVFGNTKPRNHVDAKAGLDVSPAVRDYLDLDDVSTCDWAFVHDSNVPTGPWKRITTTGLGDKINEP